ncbi:MAG: hypothetical protein HN597_14885 [Desulfobacula sp.]|jgi:hypothetical protein|uniref:hypothetical protein n=1 Tax=Desulfobacula sp. TaxID=2593537 RepID=UPI0039B8F678|nr:hypothetical protein [Desulfobacula sp.]
MSESATRLTDGSLTNHEKIQILEIAKTSSVSGELSKQYRKLRDLIVEKPGEHPCCKDRPERCDKTA